MNSIKLLSIKIGKIELKSLKFLYFRELHIKICNYVYIFFESKKIKHSVVQNEMLFDLLLNKFDD